MSDEAETTPATKRRARPAKAAPAEAPVVTEPTEGGRLRRKELVARVVAKSGAKRGEVIKVVEATLAVLGDALQAGEILVLPPLGNLQVKRRPDAKPEAPLTVKLRRGGGKGKAKEALAEAATAE